MTTIRADVVALFIDAADWSKYPALVRESTGQPMTPDEVALCGSATWDEVRAARDYLARAAESAQELADQIDESNRILVAAGLGDREEIPDFLLAEHLEPADLAKVRAVVERISGNGGAA